MYPHERSLVEQWKNEPFVILGVNSDRDLESLKSVRAKERISWRSFWNGPEGSSGPISRAWKVEGWPTLYLIDPEGVVRYSSVGADERALDAAIEALLAK